MDQRAALKAVRDRLPPGWSAELRPGATGPELVLRGADGREAALVVVVRRQVQPRDVPNLLRQAAEQRTPRLLVAPFLGPRARELLAAGEMSYADGTGNLRLVVSRPAIFLEAQGADRDPARQPRALRSLKGAAAGRVVRAVCEFSPPYGVRRLAEESSTPLGSVSRVIRLLEEEALVTRDDTRRIATVDWAALIRRWVRDYGVASSNTLASFLEPRGVAALAEKLSRLGRYAVTGSLAGPGIAPARLAMVYVDDAGAAADALEVVAADAGANVWLLEPFDDVVFERTQEIRLSQRDEPVVAAAPTQVAADLLTSPGRGPQEGEALIEQMKGAEDAWRRRP